MAGSVFWSSKKQNTLIFLLEEAARTEPALQTFPFQWIPVFWWDIFSPTYPGERRHWLPKAEPHWIHIDKDANRDTDRKISIHIHTHKYTYICIRLCVCLPVFIATAPAPHIFCPWPWQCVVLMPRTQAGEERQQMGADRERARGDDEPILLSMIDSGLSTPAA